MIHELVIGGAGLVGALAIVLMMLRYSERRYRSGELQYPQPTALDREIESILRKADEDRETEGVC